MDVTESLVLRQFYLCAAELPSKQLLLLGGDVVGYGPAHRLLGPLEALTLDLLHTSLQGGHLPGGLGHMARQVAGQSRLQRLKISNGEGLSLPLPLDGLLDEVRWQVALAADTATTNPRAAVEVAVFRRAPADADGVEESRGAAPAAEAADEVVLASVRPFAGSAPPCEHLLHLVERLDVDEGLVLALVLDAAPLDIADVEAVAQQALQLLVIDFGLRPTRAGPEGKSTHCQFGGQLRQRPVARGVGREGPRHERGPVRVRANGADLITVDDSAQVQVADRRPIRRATTSHLLLNALDDLGAQIPAVELGNAAHDAVQQDTGRRLVDVLTDADQLGTGGSYLSRDGHVIAAVASKPIDLVHDHVLDGVAADVRQHLLQSRSICFARALAAVDELARHAGAQRPRLSDDSLTLCRNGIALGITITLRLLLGAHPQVSNSKGCIISHDGRGKSVVLAHTLTYSLSSYWAR